MEKPYVYPILLYAGRGIAIAASTDSRLEQVLS
jgi:hypothetical protein